MSKEQAKRQFCDKKAFLLQHALHIGTIYVDVASIDCANHALEKWPKFWVVSNMVRGRWSEFAYILHVKWAGGEYSGHLSKVPMKMLKIIVIVY